MFMHLTSHNLKKIQCTANSSGLSDVVTKILLQVLNLLWMVGICVLPHHCCSVEEHNRIIFGFDPLLARCT